MQRQIIALFFSILTACATGGVIAMSGILAFRYVDSYFFPVVQNVATPVLAEQTEQVSINTALLEESDQDPSFVSRFSRVFIYSADDGREVIESAKSSLPTTGKAKVTAPAYVVIDLDRDAVVLEKDADKLMPIASVTKLVTAVIARKLLNQNEFITVTREALATYGNEARLREGEKLRASELLYPLLMVSSNDASEVLAQAYGRKAFLKEMNSWVNSIGAYRTYFTDPSGLSPQNVSTARDLSIITQWIHENEPDIFDLTLVKAKTVRTHTWTNPTHFLNLASYAGGKNGYTPEANRTSVALFELGKQKHLYGVMLLGSDARDSDILDLLEEAVR
jgi:D-alanyl-D-alanine carboxypeptidase